MARELSADRDMPGEADEVADDELAGDEAAPRSVSGARERAQARASGAADMAAASLKDPDRYLASFHSHYPPGTDTETYFQLTRSIVLAARRWRKLADKRIKALGQSMARWETLFLVAFSGDEMTQRELARLISIEGPTMVRMLDLLAQEGLIERRQSELDRRMTINRITPEGVEVVESIKAATNTLRAELLRDIDPAEMAICQKVLSQIVHRLDEIK
ncbi:MAG: MarR family transcriptional regulator [Sphingomonas bacterium]|nr:MarR family transcriptional regulator [Sphingomonas bacterium]